MRSVPALRLLRRALPTASLLLLVGGCNTLYGPTEPDSNWRVQESIRFSLYARPGSFGDSNAARLGELLDDQYEYVRRTLDSRYGGRIAVFLYDSPTDIKPNLPSQFSGVGFPETEAVSAVCMPPLNENLAGLLMHEANHVLMGRGIGRPGTKFMNEGMASAVMSPSHYPVLTEGIHGWARQNRTQLARLEQLVDDDRWDDVPEQTSYRSSASFLLFLMERHGAATVRHLYTVPSPAFKARVADLFGRSLEQLEADWLDFLANSGV